MIALLFSGITAFPLDTEITWLNSHKSWIPEMFHGWIQTVFEGIHETGIKYPFMAYGTDWLAFAHIVIAIAFIGPLIDPVRNKWVVLWGIINCVLIFPLTFIAGHVRAIPFYHQLVDCSFGIVGLIPLLIAYNDISKLEKLQRINDYSYN